MKIVPNCALDGAKGHLQSALTDVTALAGRDEEDGEIMYGGRYRIGRMGELRGSEVYLVHFAALQNLVGIDAVVWIAFWEFSN